MYCNSVLICFCLMDPCILPLFCIFVWCRSRSTLFLFSTLFFKLLSVFCALSFPVQPGFLQKFSLFIVLMLSVLTYSYCSCAFMGFSFLGVFFFMHCSLISLFFDFHVFHCSFPVQSGFIQKFCSFFFFYSHSLL